MGNKETRKPERIERIKLIDLLPIVFRDEKFPASEVWHKELIFQRGNNYMIEAQSGGGKSSLCAFLYGSRCDYDGTLYFDDEDVSRFGINRWQSLRRTSLAYLPQELMLFPELSAIDNIRLKNNLIPGGSVSEEKIAEWLERLGISARRDFPVGRMSVGQKQRVAFIRSLCQPFDFILLDEPVSHLDRENNLIVSALVTEVATKQGAGIISTSVGNPLLLENAKLIKL